MLDIVMDTGDPNWRQQRHVSNYFDWIDLKANGVAVETASRASLNAVSIDSQKALVRRFNGGGSARPGFIVVNFVRANTTVTIIISCHLGQPGGAGAQRPFSATFRDVPVEWER